MLYAILKPVPKLLLLGAGLDAVPLLNMAVDLGWRVTIVDHRPAYLERGGFERTDQAMHVVPRALAERVPVNEFDAIVTMSFMTQRAKGKEAAADEDRFAQLPEDIRAGR